MTTTHPYDDTPVLVEFELRPGLQEVAISAEDLVAKSTEALDRAMASVRQMARRVRITMDALTSGERPSAVELEFGLKLDVEAGALVAKTGLEAAINVKLTWQQKEVPS